MLTDIATTPDRRDHPAALRRAAERRPPGALRPLVKIAFFDHGRLVFAASNLRKDRLGEALVADGRITEEEFNRVSALMRGDRDAALRRGPRRRPG